MIYNPTSLLIILGSFKIPSSSIVLWYVHTKRQRQRQRQREMEVNGDAISKHHHLLVLATDADAWCAHTFNLLRL